VIGLYEIAYSNFGWDFWQVMSTPIPTFIDSIEALSRRIKRENKIMKKSMNNKK
jgi:DNA/RNA-binding domain of Phe-tRNA-synthetase-like protein